MYLKSQINAFWMCNHKKNQFETKLSAGKSLRSKVSCLFSIVFIWFPSSAVGNQSGVDTWHRDRIVAYLLMNKTPPSFCSSLQAFMLNFGLCNLLVERWYHSRDGTRRLPFYPERYLMNVKLSKKYQPTTLKTFILYI